METDIERNYTAGMYKSTQLRQTSLRRAERWKRETKIDNLSNSVVYTVYGVMMRRAEHFSSNFSPQFSVQHKSSVSNGNVIDADVGQDNFKSDERTCLFLALFSGTMSQLLKSLLKDQCRSVSSRYPPHTDNIH